MSRSCKNSKLALLLRIWKAYPLLFVLAFTLLLGTPIWVKIISKHKRALELYYPLSHFPMYSDFAEWEYVVFLADGAGNALPIETLTGGLRVARIKKNYNSILNEELDSIRESEGSAPSKKEAPLALKRKVGDQVLLYIREQWQQRNPASLTDYPTLQLYLQPITMAEGKVQAGEPILVGEYPNN